KEENEPPEAFDRTLFNGVPVFHASDSGPAPRPFPPGQNVVHGTVGSIHGVGSFLVYSTGVSTGLGLRYGRIRPPDPLRPRPDAKRLVRSASLSHLNGPAFRHHGPLRLL